MQRNQKVALALIGNSLSVLCLTLSGRIRFAFPFTSVDITRGFFIGLGLTAAIVSLAMLVLNANSGPEQTL